MATTPNYDIDYNDERLTQVETEEKQALTENEKMYGGMIGESDSFYDAQKQAAQDWADKQTELQNEQTDFAIEKIEQQKDQAHKDYLKEQSGAYVDWQKQSNQYGTKAEQMASAGLTNTGFSESSQVSMYNTYQNRVATAREAYGRAVLNYDNAIKDAMLQNNAALAEIAYTALQQQLELSLQGFQYKNQLVLEQANKKLEIGNIYHNQYMDVLDQINHENAVAEDIRQFNETQKWNTEQAERDRKFEADENRIQREYEAAQAVLDREHELALVEANTEAEKEVADYKHELAMKELEKQKQNELDILKQRNASNSVASSGGNSSSSGGVRISSPTDSAGIRFQLIKQNNKNNASNNKPVNMNSVMALGYGAITPTKLATLVSNGEVETYTKNGQTYYRKVNKTPMDTYKYRQNKTPAISNTNYKYKLSR